MRILTLLLLTAGFVTNAQSPSFYFKPQGQALSDTLDNVVCSVKESTEGNTLTWDITVSNTSEESIIFDALGLRLGIDCYMDKYPEWLDKYFPTLLYCEKTHFYGYFQSPSGKVMGIASPDPVACWSIDYNLDYSDEYGNRYLGHRLESINLDLLHGGPLPDHHPAGLDRLAAGQTMHWTLYFVWMESLEDYAPTISKVAGIPVIDLKQTSYARLEKFDYQVYGDGVKIKGRRRGTKGSYIIEASDRAGHKTYARVHIRKPWRKTIEQARDAALQFTQKGGSHVETYYGFFPAFEAAKRFPSPEVDSLLSQRFDYLYNLMYDAQKAEPKCLPGRIQNTALTISMLVDRYEAYGKASDLSQATRLADWMIENYQIENGAYVNARKRVYTSVIYIAKAVLELSSAEMAAGLEAEAERHFASAKAAVDQLVASQGDYDTEGQITFEDGMISCSALQMGQLAIMLPAAERGKYVDEMLGILSSHNCLTQLFVPDARRRGGTLRFWEAQYDVLLFANLLSSPHGWSAWRAYATYYAYLLTGDEKWLRETFDAADAFAQLIDDQTGQLRWAFAVDPFVQGPMIDSPIAGESVDSLNIGNPHFKRYPHHTVTLGECYVPMVSDTQNLNSCDNDVHEVFKFIAEAVLDNAFVVEREDGSVVGYNCKLRRRGNKLFVKPTEPHIKHLHTNLRSDFRLDQKGFDSVIAF